MALKRRNKIQATFSMSSMTDVIFLLLIFFMVTSTIVFPNAIKVLLPQSKQQTEAAPQARVTINRNLDYYVAFGNEAPTAVSFEQIEPWLQSVREQHQEMFVTLYADEDIPYAKVVEVLNISVENNFKMVLATRPIK
ncbi:MAG: biopolymer transporter ExbD [Bacteroidales bacterium]|nr:biopolymer transporter ExbD [Bacteroidales bacterium]MBO7378584.1 biopolymer transporter ExbD [Bacteroidales bacterium]MBP5214333.1 biopolymer transporter ExbD [Bacteroidales bacterium]MBP5764600.1 biopolymer transporter ExbD [Bacteroidales bacterium]